MTALTDYRLLGRSGLRVSPLALGTMTFGSDWGWGADAEEARRIFDVYVDRGGNLVDTSVNYTDGTSERMVGRFAEAKRERLVLATKFTMARHPGDPNSGGNHRLNIVRSVEQSLRQLDTARDARAEQRRRHAAREQRAAQPEEEVDAVPGAAVVVDHRALQLQRWRARSLLQGGAPKSVRRKVVDRDLELASRGHSDSQLRFAPRRRRTLRRRAEIPDRSP